MADRPIADVTGGHNEHRHQHPNRLPDLILVIGPKRALNTVPTSEDQT